jgi:hypothetical protein
MPWVRQSRFDNTSLVSSPAMVCSSLFAVVAGSIDDGSAYLKRLDTVDAGDGGLWNNLAAWMAVL